MSLITRIWNRITQSQDPHQRGSRWLFVRQDSGVRVDEDVALAYSAVWACVRLISETIEYLPWHVFRRDESGGRVMEPTNPLDMILDHRWNPEMDAGRCRRNIVAHALTWGNGYAEIERDVAGRIVALWPITPDRVKPDRTLSGELVYDVTNPRQANTVLNPDQMFHLAGLGWDGIVGYSPIAMAAQSIGMGIAMEKFGASYFGSGAVPSGVLTHKGTLSDVAYNRLKESWQDRHGGTQRPALLEEGMEWKTISIDPEQAQFLESRKFQVEEIARWYGIPPHKIGQLERATFCLPAGTSVSTGQGPRPIEAVMPGDSVWSHDGSGWTLSRVSKSACSGEDEILHIRTTNRAIRANGAHRFLVRRKVGKQRPIEWENEYIPASELKVGDTLICADRLPEDGVLPQPQPSIGFMEFCGLLLGDGNVYPGWGVSIARASDTGYMDHYRAVMRAEFRRYDGGNGRGDSTLVALAPVSLQENERQTKFASVLAARRLERLGFCGTAHTKQVPGWVFMLPESHRLAFVRGFLDADGTVDNKGRIAFSSCNETLLDQIRHLCISCGVPVTNMRCQTGKTTLPTGARIAFSQWGFVCSDPGQNRRIGSNDPRYVERMESGKPFDRKGRKYPRHGGRGFDLTGCSLSRIASITREPAEPVYDLEVEGTHNFIADGVVVHNSNIEHQAIEFVQSAIMPWVDRLERAANTQLIRRDQRRLHTKVVVRSLLRGDLSAQSQFYREMVNAGILTPNEARREMERNPGPKELDKHYMQGAMLPTDSIGQKPEPPEPPPDNDPPDNEPRRVNGRRPGVPH